ncbi:caldesmon isoform X2 [Zonotrichia albicollis]|uniref:caldesmon isoform X2 n=1 Tax=Zonotrichia albicollis TaxID=44394 RepID=UPI003D811E81
MDDFERRRELRRQKREEMRLEAERLSYQRNDDDDEEAARERRRRARQERLRQKEEGDVSGEATEKSEVNAQNSVAGEESKRSLDDEAALLERLARREERRQKRLQEALERQKELDPTITDGSLSAPSRREVNNVEENATTGKEETETVTKSYQRNNWRQDGEEEGKKEEKDKEEEKPKEEENQVDVTAEKPADKEEAVTVNAEEHKAENDTNAVPEGTQSVADEEKAEQERKEAEERERLKAEEEKRAAEEKQRAEEEKRAAEEKQRAEEEKRAAEERAKAEEERREAEERERAKAEEERRAAEEKQKAEEERRAAEERAKAEEEKRAAEEKAKLEAEKLKEKQKMEEQKIEEEKRQAAALKKQEEEKVEAKKEKLPEEKPQATSIQDQDDKGKAPKEEMKSVWDRKKAQNGEQEPPASKLKPTENAFGRSGAKGAAEEAKPGVEALKRLEDQRRRRGESEELEKLKEKQQEAAAELGELKKKREERRKVLEEEEQKKKQEEAERKIREEEEKRRMKEEIEKRRAEAAEKRQKMPEDGVSEDKKPFKCLSPKGSSLKIEERTEFLNKSAQKSGMKPTQTTAVVSKIDSRLEQYTSALGSAKTSRPKASDLHVPAEGVRNIKSMWEKGNVFSSPSGTGTPNKETAGLKVGVSSRINEWLTKTPEGNKSPAPKPSDLRPGDVSGKRNLWEKQSVEKPGAASKVSATGKKSETNGVRQEP